MNRILQEDARQYLLSGKASLIVRNTQPSKPGVPRQYRFVVKKKPNRIGAAIWFVHFDNEYIAHIIGNRCIPAESFRAESLYKRERAAFLQIWEWIATQTTPDHIEYYHDGKCGHCSRHLTDADSVRVGIGPECRKKLGIVIAKAAAHAD